MKVKYGEDMSWPTLVHRL